MKKNNIATTSMISLSMPLPPPPPPCLDSPPGFGEHKNLEKGTSAASSNANTSFLKKGDIPKFHPIERHSNPVPPARASKVLERKPSEDINESAEAFIKKFRQQLVLQRLESLENYKDMMERSV